MNIIEEKIEKVSFSGWSITFNGASWILIL